MSSPIKKIIQERVAINAWLSIPHPWTAEIMAKIGLDLITLDTQHGLIDYSSALSMLQAIAITNTPTIVRVPWNEPTSIMKFLDAGAEGIVCPMVNNKEEAEQFVQACRYPPLGYRSFGPIRANMDGEENYLQKANDSIITLAQIETAAGLENLEDILSIPGLDGVYVGTIDLSISMGLEDHGNLNNPRLAEGVKQIIETVNKAGKIGGIHTMDPDDINKVVNWGYHIITPMNDTSILKSQSIVILERTKELIEKV